MTDANIETLQALARLNFNLDLQGAAKVASGINSDLNGISRQLYGVPVNAAFDNLVTLLGGRAATFPGTSGSYWETPHHADFNVVDLDIRATLPQVVVTGVNRDIISKYTPAAQQSFEWRYNAFGFNEIVWSTTGANALTDTVGITGERAIRFTMDVDDGAGNRVLTWYNSDNGTLNGNWVVQQVKTIAGITSIFNSTAVVRIGARGDGPGGNDFQGKISRLEMRAGINGAIIANPDFRFKAPGTTTFADTAPTPKTWTLVGSAGIT